MNVEISAALRAIEEVFETADNAECLEYFDQWSCRYDDDVKKAGGNLQSRTAELFMKVTENMEVREILDAGQVGKTVTLRNPSNGVLLRKSTFLAC